MPNDAFLGSTRCFVSFSSKDDEFVRRLLSRLRAQHLDVWDYSNEGSEIPGGEHVQSYLAQRVEACTLFVPVLSLNAFCSEHVQNEVRTSIGLLETGRIRIIPIVDALIDFSSDCPEPFSKLSELKYFKLPFTDRTELESVVNQLCCNLGLPYNPLFREDPRLPFMDRFEAELEKAIPRNSEHNRSLYRRLLQAMTEFSIRYKEGRFEEALTAIRYFLTLCGYEYPSYRFYYPYLVEAICLTSLSRYAEAAESVIRLRFHPLCDESFHGMLGAIRQFQGAYREALAYYKVALDMKPADTAAATGVIANAILTGEMPPEQAIRVIKTGEAKTDADRRKIQSFLAIGLANLNVGEEAINLFEALREQSKLSEVDVDHYADLLEREGKLNIALEVLKDGTRKYPDSIPLHKRLGRFYWKYGHAKKAFRIHKKLLQLEGGSLVSHYNLLRVAAGMRYNKKRLRMLAQTLLQTDLPKTPDEYYFSGYANWVIGRNDRALYDFERSGRSQNDFYTELE